MESHPLLAVAILALLARLLVAVGVAILHHGTLFLDDAQYVRLAREAADGETGSWDPYFHLLYWHTRTLLWPVTGLFAISGGAAIAGQLYVVALGTATAVLTTKLALYFLTRRGALLAGIIVALLPSQILWSSIVMKDAAVWALLVGIAVTLVAARRAHGWRLVACGGGIVLMLVGLGFLRFHTMEIALVALLLAAPLGPARGRVVRVASAATILALIPLTFGMGIAGLPFIANSGSLPERRALNAVGADTAVVAPADPATPAPDDEALSDPVGASLSYVPKGLTVIALRPYPWEVTPEASLGVKLAGLEAVLWYGILALALVGLLTSLGRRVPFLAFPLLVGGATALMYGLTEGNVGTAYRHRGEFVWVVALLAAMGVEFLVRQRAARRRSGEVHGADRRRLTRSTASDRPADTALRSARRT